MKLEQIQNIEHCDVDEIFIGGKRIGYTIKAEKGYLIHLNNGAEDTEDVWVDSVSIPTKSDFSQVDIRAKKDVPILIDN